MPHEGGNPPGTARQRHTRALAPPASCIPLPALYHCYHFCLCFCLSVVCVCVCVIFQSHFPQGEAHSLCPFVLCFLLSSLGVPELWLPVNPSMLSSTPESLANWSSCCPTLPGCPAPRSRILKNLGGRGVLIVAVASFLGVPGNNSM